MKKFLLGLFASVFSIVAIQPADSALVNSIGFAVTASFNNNWEAAILSNYNASAPHSGTAVDSDSLLPNNTTWQISYAYNMTWDSNTGTAHFTIGSVDLSYTFADNIGYKPTTFLLGGYDNSNKGGLNVNIGTTSILFSDIAPKPGTLTSQTISGLPLSGSFLMSETNHSISDNLYWYVMISNFEKIPAVVPIPGAVWLLTSGLIGLVVIRRRKINS